MIPLYIRQPYGILQLKQRAEMIRTLCAGQATSPRKDTELDIMIQAAMAILLGAESNLIF